MNKAGADQGRSWGWRWWEEGQRGQDLRRAGVLVEDVGRGGGKSFDRLASLCAQAACPSLQAYRFGDVGFGVNVVPGKREWNQSLEEVRFSLC